MAENTWNNLSKGDVLEPRLPAVWDEAAQEYVSLSVNDVAETRVVNPEKGSCLITNTSLYTGEFATIKAFGGPAVIDSIESSTFPNDSELSGLVLDTDDLISGVFTSIKLTSGKVIVYSNTLAMPSFSPQDLNPIAHWSAGYGVLNDSGSSAVHNDPLADWGSRAHSLNATQATASYRPTYLEESGTSLIQFDGVDDTIDAFSTDFDNLFDVNKGSCTLVFRFGDANIWTDGAVRMILDFEGGSSEKHIRVLKHMSTNEIEVSRSDGSNTSSLSTDALTGSTDWFVLTVNWDTAADTHIEFWANNTLIGNVAMPASGHTSPLHSDRTKIGSNRASDYHVKGELAETLFTSKSLTSTEVADTYNYFANKYGIS